MRIKNYTPFPMLCDESREVAEAIRAGIRAAGTGRAQEGPACHLVDSRAISSYPAAGGDGIHHILQDGGRGE